MMLAARGAIRASGAGLPYDAEVEYLESSGTQYIDTGFKANTTTTRLDIELMLTQGTANMGLFGSRNSSGTSSSSSCNAFFLSANQVFRMDWANGDGPFFNCSQNTAYSISITRGSVTINGSITTYSVGGSEDQANNFLIFSFAEGSGVVYQNGMIGRVFGAKIYSNNLLVRDFIPVRKKTVGYLYDRVSGKLFGNAGTGDFVLGPDVVPVEYIESHGTEYIDTGIILNDTYGIDINFAPMEGLPGTGINEHGIFGSSTSGSVHNVLQIHTSSGGVGLWMPRTTRIAVCPITTELGIPQHWQINLANSGNVLINGTASGSTRPATSTYCPYPVYLFARDVANAVKSGSYSKMRLYSWTVEKNSTALQNYVSVRVGTDATSWEGAMMDVLTRRIYRNAGTGAFTYGNDLKYPIPA